MPPRRSRGWWTNGWPATRRRVPACATNCWATTSAACAKASWAAAACCSGPARHCAGDAHVLLLTGIGGGGKSTLATRLANRCKQDGYRVVPLQARRGEPTSFGLRLVTELATACQRLGREADERMLRDGQRPLADRLRLAVEVLNEAPILLVLDNLEALMPPPPAPCAWSDPDFAVFVRELALRLTGAGRAILTCRYVPDGWDAGQGNVLHEALPDFTEADFFKYLRRHDRVARRMEQGELSRELLARFHRTLGGTPRFVEQASAVLARIDPDRLCEQLDALAEPADADDADEIRRLQQDYFRDLFLPQLYDALPAEYQRAQPPGGGRIALAVGRRGGRGRTGRERRCGRGGRLVGLEPGPAVWRSGRSAAVRRVSASPNRWTRPSPTRRPGRPQRRSRPVRPQPPRRPTARATRPPRAADVPLILGR